MTSPTLLYLKRWISNPLKMGSVVPSSRRLCRAVAQHALCGPDQVVLEYGGGSGGVTQALLELGVPGERIYSIEIEEDLAAVLAQTCPQVRVIHGDCRKVDTLVPAADLARVGAVIVGIPMVVLPIGLQQEIIASIFRLLPPGQPFLHYTYCATSPLDCGKLGLRGQRVGFVVRNLPPASVWAYHRRSDGAAG